MILTGNLTIQNIQKNGFLKCGMWYLDIILFVPFFVHEGVVMIHFWKNINTPYKCSCQVGKNRLTQLHPGKTLWLTKVVGKYLTVREHQQKNFCHL